MKNKSLLVTAGLVILAANVQAQLPIDGVHYPAGLEGIKGGSLPEPGIYFRDDNLFYTGTSDLLSDFKTFVYLQAPHLTWMTDWKILGANYGMDVLVPFVYKEASYHEILAFKEKTASAVARKTIRKIRLIWPRHPMTSAA